MNRPNIIWVFSDQQPAYTLGCNGDPNARTPNIDRMAASGWNFRNAVSGFPLCCPFRGSLLTGRYPHHCVPGHEFQMPPEMPTAADMFNAAGYDTAYFGKWHLDGKKEAATRRVAKIEIPFERRGRFNRWIGYENNNMQYDSWVHGHLDSQTPFPMQKLPGYETDELTTLLLDYLEERPGKEEPFFAVLSVQPPHNPYIAPPEYKVNYNPQDIKLRPNVAHNPGVVEKVREDLAGMYAMIENLDANIGRVLDTLRRTKLEENTWIIFFSDHGDMHGSHGLFKKTNPYQESGNVPFIVWNNDAYRSFNHNVNGCVEYPINTVDILPTTLGLAGVDLPGDLEGFDYSPIFRGQRTLENAPASAFLQNVVPTLHHNSIDRPYRGVLTADKWKYVCTERDDWLLFNLNNDPYEECNLAFNTIAKGKRDELRQLVHDWIIRTNDSFRMPDF
jgi:arylsulfatase A-like enzyme